jgi:5'(3')-deoxyribonucleotidase
MNIGLDIDSTLLDTMTEYVKVFNQTYGTNYSKFDVKNFDFYKDWKVDKSKAYKIFELIDYDKVTLTDSSVKYVCKALKQLGYQVDLITANTLEMTEIKSNRLKDLGVIFDDVKRVDVHGGKKGKFAREYNFIIDDSIEQLEDIFFNGGNPICYNQPWNQEWNGNHIYKLCGLLRHI